MAPAAAARWGFPALMAGALAIAVVPILVRMSEVGPAATAFWRLALGVPGFLLWRRLWPSTTRPATHRDIGWMALAGLFFAGDLGVWHWCIGLTSVANAALLPNLAPVFVTAAAFLVFGERPDRTFLLGLLLALAGVVVLVGGSVSIDRAHLVGDALGVVAAMFYGGYLLIVQRLRGRHDTPTIMAWSGAAAAGVLLVLALGMGERIVPRSAAGVGVVLGLAWFSQVVGQGLIGWALAHLSAAVSSVGLLFQPVGAALLAAWLFGEPLGWRQLLGAALVLGGILVVRASSPKSAS